MHRIITAFRQFPYTGIGCVWFGAYALLKCFPAASFPRMSIIPLVLRQYGLESEEEFRVRYYISKIGFESQWTSKDRSTEDAVASFYNEHDADLWRQAYLSKTSYMYKKKILRAYHIVKKVRAQRILDYGCGAGVFAHYISQKGYAVDVADIPSPTLEFVRSQVNVSMAATIDATLVLQQDAYDFVSCLDALEHTFTPLQITKQLLVSLRPGGIFHVTFPKEDEAHMLAEDSQHTKEAQLERPATFAYLRTVCDELVPELVYRKR